MIIYVDSSIVARSYLADESSHEQAARLLRGREHLIITTPITRIEVTGALVRAARAGRLPDLERRLSQLDADLQPGGTVTVVRPPVQDVERQALALVRDHGLRALDAVHLATALTALPSLAPAGERLGFATHDAEQQRVAAEHGLAPA